MPEIQKNFKFEAVMTFFRNFVEKFRHNPQIFKSRSGISSFRHTLKCIRLEAKQVLQHQRWPLSESCNGKEHKRNHLLRH